MRGRGVVSAIAAVLGVCAILVAAAAAQAAWKVEGVTLGSTTKQATTISGGLFTLEGLVGGVPFKITATGVECLAGVGICSVDGSSFGTNHTTDTLRFTGVNVVTPSGCELPGHSLTTKALVGQVVMSGTSTYDKLTPAVKTTIAALEFMPSSCLFYEMAVVFTGSLTPKMESTGVELVSQPLVFSEENQMNGGGSLVLGPRTATLTGTAATKLASGQKFGVTE
jgi:hypothetical protein